MSGRIAFVLKGYPRLSETFIAQEIAALEARGLAIDIVSLRRPTDAKTHPVHARIRAAVRYLPEYLYREPLRVLRAWLRVRRWPRYRQARAAWLADWRRDPTPNRGRRFGQALVLADETGPDIVAFHAHFLHTPGSVARYASLLTGKPWSVSAHAKDIWTIPDWEKREKLAEARFAVTCTAIGAAHLASLAPPERVRLVYHGLDLAAFPRRERVAGQRLTILSVGRAVPKKGYEDLLEALALLPADLDWRFVHVGGGKERKRLVRRARRLGLAARTEWRGALAQPDVIAAYRSADVFALASRVAADGDRDGLPNVLMEAQSQGLACVATRISAIPELIEDGRTGLLVEPGDRAALAGALERVLRDGELRRRLGDAGEARMRAAFDHEAGIDRIARLLTDGHEDRVLRAAQVA
jgi:glycosyltransferase involved in cell wall biosynthesis